MMKICIYFGKCYLHTYSNKKKLNMVKHENGFHENAEKVISMEENHNNETFQTK